MEILIGGRFQFELFISNNNFTIWQKMMKDLLIQKGLCNLEDNKPVECRHIEEL